MTENTDRFQEFVDMIIELKKELVFDSCVFNIVLIHSYTGEQQVQAECTGYSLGQEYYGQANFKIEKGWTKDPELRKSYCEKAYKDMFKGAWEELGLFFLSSITGEANKQCSTK